MTTYILGINAGPHDGSAALLKNGHLVAMAEQERFSRNKHAFDELPVDAIKFCLDNEKIGLHDISSVVIGWDLHVFSVMEAIPFDEAEFLSRLFPRNVFKYRYLPSVQYIPHHIAHAASAFWPSGFENSGIIVVDGRGEEHATTVAYGVGKDIHVLKQFGIQDSLGNYYGLSAEWAGFDFWDAGKFMGLTSYGQPTQSIPLTPTNEGYTFSGMPSAHSNPRRRYLQQCILLYKYYRRENYPYTTGEGSEPMAYANFAASVQVALEKAIIGLAKYVKCETRSENLVLVGGVALNCMANLRLAETGLFKRIFIQPVAHDAGVSLGAALYAWHNSNFASNNPPQSMKHAYWGPSYNTEQVIEALKPTGLPYVILMEDDLISYVANCLCKHQIVGWFQGRAEVGPRALGARSILGNPSQRKNLLKINRLKGREVWRPLAPSVPEEDFASYFESPLPSEFMIVAATVQKDRQCLIPAVVHVDGSARPQVVNQTTNQRYWKLIKYFGKLTGIPVIINTSFNLKGKPIVNTPQDAIGDFLTSEMDVLAIENCVINKNSLG